MNGSLYAKVWNSPLDLTDVEAAYVIDHGEEFGLGRELLLTATTIQYQHRIACAVSRIFKKRGHPGHIFEKQTNLIGGDSDYKQHRVNRVDRIKNFWDPLFLFNLWTVPNRPTRRNSR